MAKLSDSSAFNKTGPLETICLFDWAFCLPVCNERVLTFLSPFSSRASMSSSVISLSLEANTWVAPWRMMDSISSFPSLLALGSTSRPTMGIIMWPNVHAFHPCKHGWNALVLQWKKPQQNFHCTKQLGEGLWFSRWGRRVQRRRMGARYLAVWRWSPAVVSSRPAPRSSPPPCSLWWSGKHAPASAGQSCELGPGGGGV